MCRRTKSHGQMAISDDARHVVGAAAKGATYTSLEARSKLPYVEALDSSFADVEQAPRSRFGGWMRLVVVVTVAWVSILLFAALL